MYDKCRSKLNFHDLGMRIVRVTIFPRRGAFLQEHILGIQQTTSSSLHRFQIEEIESALSSK